MLMVTGGHPVGEMRPGSHFAAAFATSNDGHHGGSAGDQERID
jgi:hypothetical protein